MNIRILCVLALALSVVLGGPIGGWAADDPAPTEKMRLTLRGGRSTDPAQAEAARAAARQAEADAARAEEEKQQESARRRSQNLSDAALRQRDAPLQHFGVLTGPLAPTSPTGFRR